MSIWSVAFGDQATSIEATGPRAEELVELACRHLDRCAVPAEVSLRVDARGVDAGVFELTSKAGRLLATKSPGELVDRLVFELTFRLVDKSRGGAHVHGALVVRDGRGILVPGESGVGKSTLTAELVRRGWLHATDELAYVPAGTFDASGFARPIHLKPGSRALGDALGLEDGLHCIRSEIGDFVHPEAFGGARHRGAVVVVAIAFVRWAPNGDESVLRATPPSATFGLRQALMNARNLPAAGVTEAARLARAIPAVNVTYRSFDFAARALDELLTTRQRSAEAEIRVP